MTTTMMVTRLLLPTQRPPRRPILAPKNQRASEKPRKQKKCHYDQNYHHKYRYEPTPHVLTSPVKRRSLKKRRQHEHNQEQDYKDGDHYAEFPTYTPSPRSSLSRRLPPIYTL